MRGLGGGFLPECMVRPYVENGHMVVKRTERPVRQVRLSYAWRGAETSKHGRALQWWLKQLESPPTRTALLEGRHGF